MSTPGTMPPSPLPPPGPPGAPAQKSKTWVYVLLGCGGCLGVAAVIAVVGVFVVMRGSKEVMNTVGTGIALGAEQAQVDGMVKDPARKDRIDKAFAELEKMAQNGELKMEELEPLTAEVDKVTKGKTTLSDEDADEVAETAEKLAGSH